MSVRLESDNVEWKKIVCTTVLKVSGSGEW